jgi:hypothetical protein
MWGKRFREANIIVTLNKFHLGGLGSKMGVSESSLLIL